jgi:uncharacterized protein YacL
MDNLFYLFGILYFVVSTYNFFTYDHFRDVSVDVDTNISDLVEETEEKEQENQAKTIKKYYPRYLLGLMFFIWTYIGCFGNFPEKSFFIYNLIILSIYTLILIFLGFSLAYKAYRTIENKFDFPIKEKCKKKYIPLTKIVYFSEMIIVGLIITIHYLIF